MPNLMGLIKKYTSDGLSDFFYKTIYFHEYSVAANVYRHLHNHTRSKSSDAERSADAFTENTLTEILNVAVSNCRYYKEFLNKKKVNADDLSIFPLLSKAIIKSHFEKLINPNLNRLKWISFNTGGSTGEPLEFRVTRQCGLVDRVHQRNCFEQMGYKTGDKIFSFDGVMVPPPILEKKIYWVKKSKSQLPYGSIHYSSHHLNDATAKIYLDSLQFERPAFLRGYPSVIASLANRLLDDRIKLRGLIKGILLTSESVLDYQYHRIKEAFAAPITVQYGHSEMAVFATQSPDSGVYVCSPFYGYVEVTDIKGKHVGIGEVGEIVVTGYYNTAMPFIRYKTGDWAVYAGKRDGATVLSSLQGRDQDYVYSMNNEKVSITGLIFGRHYRAFKNIDKWQIRQNTPGYADVLIVPKQAFNEADRSEIVKSFKDLASIHANPILVSFIPLTKGGKFKFVIHD